MKDYTDNITGSGTTDATDDSSYAEIKGGTQEPLTVTLTKSDITEIVYCESAWHCALRPQLPRLTPDHERTVMRLAGEGLTEMLGRTGAWVQASAFKPASDEACVSVTFRPVVENTDALAGTLHGVLAELLAAHVLRARYGDDTAGADGYFGTMWRKCMAHLLLLMSRQELRAERCRHSGAM